jgi:small subunit ribosomal protein S10
MPRIKLISTNQKELDEVCDQIIKVAEELKVKHSGIIRLPTKILHHTVRKTPCGDGSDTYEHWQLRIYRRIIDIESNEKAFRQIMRLPVPPSIKIEITV